MKKVKSESYKGWRVSFKPIKEGYVVFWSKGEWKGGGNTPTKTYGLDMAKKEIDRFEAQNKTAPNKKLLNEFSKVFVILGYNGYAKDVKNAGSKEEVEHITNLVLKDLKRDSKRYTPTSKGVSVVREDPNYNDLINKFERKTKVLFSLM